MVFCEQKIPESCGDPIRLCVGAATIRRIVSGSFFQKTSVFLAFILVAQLSAAPARAEDPPPHGHSAAEFEHMATDLKRSLDAKPGDADNWILLGRTLASLDRWNEAKDAFAHAIALRPDDPTLHAQLGEVLTLEAGGTVVPAARAEFGLAPEDPRSRYYLAVALAQSGDTSQAIVKLRSLASDAPPDAPWRQLVVNELQTLHGDGLPDATPEKSLTSQLQDELATLGAGAPGDAGKIAPAPPPATPPAAPPAAPTAPQQNLAARLNDLETHVRLSPGDEAGWLALGRAYQAEGDEAKATETFRRANQAIPADRNLLMAYADQLADGIKGETLPENFVGVMRQINAIDPDQVDALWYLGLAAAQRGDAHRAAGFWRRLASDLPAGSKDRKTVQERLDALP